jgi:hypothetical protein
MRTFRHNHPSHKENGQVTSPAPHSLLPVILLVLSSGALRLVLQRFLYLTGQLVKSFRLLCGQVGKYFAIKLDAGQLQTVHELRIVKSIKAGGGADTYDPQTAKIAFA